MRLKIKIAIGLFVLGLVYLIYFATQVSAVYPPVKSYKFRMTKDELSGQLIKIINSRANAIFKLTDSTGTKEERYYYCDIIIEEGEYKYNIKYQSETSFWDKELKSRIDLIGAFDIGHNTGGYKTEDKDVDKLLDIFEREIIEKLNENTSR